MLVASWLGSTNLGDELLFRSLHDTLVELGGDVRAISMDPEATERTHGVRAVRHKDLFGIRAAVREADLLVFGGGGLLQDETSRFNLPYHLSRVAMARRARTPVVAVGLGVGPLDSASGRAQVRAAFSADRQGRAIPVAVRDVESAAVLAGLGIPCTTAADLALGLTPAPVPSASPRLGVCLRPWSGGGLPPVEAYWKRGLQNDPFADAVASALDTVISERDIDVDFIAFQEGRDDILHTAIASRMREHKRTRLLSPSIDQVFDVIGACTGVLSMRYHGGMLAALMGRPSLLVGYSAKVPSLAMDLGDGARMVGGSHQGRAMVDAGLADELRHLLDQAPTRSKAVQESVSRLRRRGEGNRATLESAFAQL